MTTVGDEADDRSPSPAARGRHAEAPAAPTVVGEAGTARVGGGRRARPGADPGFLGWAATASGFAVLDIETTGFSPTHDRVVEIALICCDEQGRAHDEWTVRVDPQRPMGATHIHGITDADVAGAPHFAEAVPELIERMRGRAVVAHRAVFDLGFLRAEFTRAGWALPELPTLCTLEASQHYLPFLERRRLVDCCWASGIDLTDAHSALGDARATSILLRSYLDPEFGFAPLPEHVSLPAEASAVTWPEAPFGPPQEPEPTAPGSPAWTTARRQSEAARLGPLIERFAVADALDNGAPTTALIYLDVLAEALEDGELSPDEQSALADVARVHGLDAGQLPLIHRAFVSALAAHAVDDGLVSRAEKAELHAVGELVGLDTDTVTALVEEAMASRQARLDQQCRPLPDPWEHGEPLRVGDRVAFTGGEESTRTKLEQESTRRGLRISSSVSRRTAALITDGDFVGTKARAAQAHGIRTIGSHDLLHYLEYLQPAPDAKPVVAVKVTAPPHQPGTPTRDVVDLTAVREWARGEGLPVGVRGRIAQDVLAAYRQATGIPG